MNQSLRQIWAVACILVWQLLLPFFLIRSIFTTLFKGRSYSLDGLVVVVTGAGNGLGKEMAMQLVTKHNCNVVCVDMKATDLDEAVKSINAVAAKPDMACAFTCDITDTKRVDELRDFVVEKYGRVDMVINNAAFMYISTLSEGSDRHISRCMEVNLLGQIWVSRSFLVQMKKQKSGRLVYINSGGALNIDPGLAMYCTSKAALATFALVLEKELRTNPEYDDISVSTAYPSFIDTTPVFKELYTSNLTTMPVKNAAADILEGARRKILEFTLPGGEFGVRVALWNGRILPKSFEWWIARFLSIKMARATEDTHAHFDKFLAPDSSHRDLAAMHDSKKSTMSFNTVVQ